MRNAGLDEAQAGIKIARRNINNLRYADDSTLMAMAPHSSILAWKIPWMEELGRLTERVESMKGCSLCLLLHCCPANKFFSTIFLDSLYMP